MKKVRVGVIGCGAIGKTHIERITNKIPNAEVTAVADYFPEASKAVADKYSCTMFATGEEVINSELTDAILIASADPSHAGYVLESIKAGKRVFCEKPLAQKADDCIAIMEAEEEKGRILTQVGFMRRYDPGYVEIKKMIDSGKYGVPLMIHEKHRNAYQTGSNFETNTAIYGVCIHEIDISRWLTDDEYISGQVLTVRQSSETDGDYLNPQIVNLQTSKGVRIDVEIIASGAYAYDIQCEVVTEKAAISLPNPPSVNCRTNYEETKPLMHDWSQRFPGAYDIEIQAWIDAVQEGRDEGPTAWDGYVAAVTADTLIKSRSTGKAEKIDLIRKPSIYVK